MLLIPSEYTYMTVIFVAYMTVMYVTECTSVTEKIRSLCAYMTVIYVAVHK